MLTRDDSKTSFESHIILIFLDKLPNFSLPTKSQRKEREANNYIYILYVYNPHKQMARINNSDSLQMTEQAPSQAPPSTVPFKVQESIQSRKPNFFIRNLFRNLFLTQLILISLLIIFLSIRGLISSHAHNFHPMKFYPPLLSSAATSAFASLTWHSLTKLTPSKTLKSVFWLSPLLTCALGVLLIAIGSAPSLALAAIFIISAVIQSLYSCWVSPRFVYTIRLISISLNSPPKKITTIVFLVIISATIYSGFVIVGIGGATATKTIFDYSSIFIILLSLTWTVQIIQNTMLVAFARVKYFRFSYNTDFDTYLSLRDTIKDCTGSVCIGSVLVPFLDLVRGSARTVRLVSENNDEFMFSCVDCFSKVGSGVTMWGNRWGFVYLGVYNMGFVKASGDTWQLFRRVGLEPVVDSDLISSFCLFSGVAVGSLSALVGGSWALLVYKHYATEICIYAFLIGYFLCRTATTWPQASVLAYHVAYAENPDSDLFDSTIPDRVKELQRYQTHQNTENTHPTDF